MHLILDRDKWRCGRWGEYLLGEGTTSLSNAYGYQCCMGQFANQCGASEDKIKHESLIYKSMIMTIHSKSARNKLETLQQFQQRAVSINDNGGISTKQRVTQLRDLLTEYGHTLELVNFRPDELPDGYVKPVVSSTNKKGKNMSSNERAVDWNKVFRVVGNSDVVDFATGRASGRRFYDSAVNTTVGGEVRSLLRSRGVEGARVLARKACRRRHLV